jgi:hypothetical protein
VRSRKGVSRPSVQTERGDGDEVTNVTPPDRFFHLLWRVAVLGLLSLLPSRGSFMSATHAVSAAQRSAAKMQTTAGICLRSGRLQMLNCVKAPCSCFQSEVQ